MGKKLWEREKGFTLSVSNKDMNDFIKIKKSLENSNVSIDSITETVKYKIKKQEYRFLPTLVASLVASLM